MTQGYYDFYIGLNDTSKYISFSLMDGSEGNSIHFAIYSGNLCYYTPSSGWNNLQSAVNNKLYHCAITFNVNYDWNITIDGTFYEELSYYNNPVSMDIIQIRTTGSSYDYYGYIDAIGISNQGYHQLSNIPDGFINNTGNFEFWVNTNDTLTFQLGSQNFYHNTTSISSCVWTHYYYTWNLTSYSLYINSTLEFQNQTFPFNFDSFSWINSSTSQQYYLDAIDSDIFYSNYSIHQNLEVNDTIIWDWNLYPAWVSSHYGLNSSFSDFTITTDGQPEHNIVDFNGHQDVMQIYNEGSTGYTYLDDFTSTNPSQISYELYFAQSSVPEIGGIYITGDSGTAVQIYTQHGGGGMMKAYDGASNTNLFYISANTFYYLRIDVDCLTDTWDMWINDTKYVDGWDFRVNNDYIEKIRIAILDTYFTAASLYIDGYINSEYPEYFPNIARIDNTTVEPLAIPIDNTFSYLNPYHFILSNCSTNILTLHISDMYNNTLEYSSVNKNEEYRYIPDEIRQAFISIRNQQGQYLNWENYRLYLNGTVLYSNTFERVLNSVWNITIKDNFDYQLASTLHTIDRDSNYIDITLTQYSLKIYNQQEVYNYVNITKDPLYYDNDNYWSQWIAPNEIIDYQLYSGYYVVNVSNNEESSFAAYSYTLNNDDILIISSDNTITNTITNIQNVNTTLGNQITAVNITIDNVNSSISNQIVSVDINLGNVNSTLGTQLLNLETALLNVNSSLSVLYASIDTSIVSMNNTIYNAVISSNTSLYTQGNQILGNLTYVLQFNPELTAVLTNTLFSENLTWSNNITTVYEQVDDYSFVNEYNDESLLIELKYENYIKELLLGAQTSITQSIKNEDIEYRVKSINTGQYLSEWADLNDTVVDLGFYDAPLGQTDIYNTEINDWLFLIIVIVIFIGVLVYTIIRLRNTNTIKNSSDNYHNSQRKDLILG